MKKASSIDKDLLNSLSLDQANILLLTGIDADIAIGWVQNIKIYLKQKIKTFEQRIINQDNSIYDFLQEIENQSIFENYRLILVYDGYSLLESVVEKKKNLAHLRSALMKLPERILLVFSYQGNPKKNLLKLFADCNNVIQIETKPLYGNQINQNLVQTMKKNGIVLATDAWEWMNLMADQKSSSHLALAQKLKKIYPQRTTPITKEELEVLFIPERGMHIFDFIDYLFTGNKIKVHHELERYEENQDSFLLILKLMLKRINEIRKFDCAYQMRYTTDEIKNLLNIVYLPIFIQNKIINRLQIEVNRLPMKRQVAIYNLLIKTQTVFRRNIAMHEQKQYFRQEVLPMFLLPDFDEN